MGKTYGKLIRDNIPAIITASGSKPVTRILDDQQYLEALIAKLREETTEFEADYSPEELADIAEVILAIRDALGISEARLEAIRSKKAASNGAFKDKIYLEYVE